MTYRPTWKQAVAAIEARRNGVFDDADLMAMGPLFINADEDILYIKLRALQTAGFVVGTRDPRVNTDYPGSFMVVEAHEESELPTQDGSNGPWAIVGNDLPKLIDEAFEVWAGE